MSQLYTDRAEQEHADVPKRTIEAKKADAPPVVARQVQKYPQFNDEITQMFLESDRDATSLGKFVFKKSLFLLGDVQRCDVSFLKQLPHACASSSVGHRE